MAVLPFTVPAKFYTDTFGVIITNRCTWSICIFNSTTSQPCCCVNALIHFSTSSAIFPSNILNLYFGTHTIWYWQCHIVCDNFLNRLICFSFAKVVGTTQHWINIWPLNGHSQISLTIPKGHGFKF